MISVHLFHALLAVERTRVEPGEDRITRYVAAHLAEHIGKIISRDADNVDVIALELIAFIRKAADPETHEGANLRMLIDTHRGAR
jgi:hypothetical protein